MEKFNKGFKDYTGYKTGKLTVISFDSWHYQPSGQRKSKWKCLCECGNEFVAFGSNLAKKTHTTSCGCEKKQVLDKYRERLRSGEWEPSKLIGKRFGRLVVTSFVKWVNTSESRISLWDCQCDCGNTIQMRRSYLVTTEVPSCGCWLREFISENSKTHGMSSTPTYKSWSKMKERCYLESYAEPEYYRDRGITVCDRWINSFENFLEDMGERPDGMTLDRIDVNKGYFKENCRWADSTIQAYNSRKRSDNTSGRTGVQANKKGGWDAFITYYKETIKLANNVSFEEACKAREDAEIKYYGVNKE